MNCRKRAVLFVGGMIAAAAVASESRTSVFVSIVPQAHFVERIGGDRVSVQSLVKPGHNPHTYEPTSLQMAALSDADVYFRIGVPFEKVFLPKIGPSAKNLRIVDTREGIRLRRMESHIHEPGGACCPAGREGDPDPHIWTSPRLVKRQAQTIAAALCEIDPDGRPVYERNVARFVAELDDLDASLTEALQPVKGKALMVFHPAWGYFAEDYGLRQLPIQIEGKEPSGRHLARIIEAAQSEGVRVIFVQPQFSRAQAQTVADALGGVAIPLDPLSPHYVENLRSVAQAIRDALETQQ